MAGLLQQGMQQPQQPPPQRQARQPRQPQQGQPQQQPQGENDDRVNATPEKAGPQFEVLLEAMLGYLYGKGMDQVTQMLQQGDDITRRMGQVIGTVMVTTYNQMAKQGKTIPPNVMVRAGMELAKAVGEMAMQMGRLEKGDDEPVEAAFMVGLGQFGKNASPKSMTPEQRQKYAQIVQALREGKRQSTGGQPPQGQSQPQQQPQQAQGQPGGMQ